METSSSEAAALAQMPEAREWSAPEDWISCAGNCELAIGCSLIFCPPFEKFGAYILREGCVSEENVREWERATNNDRRAIEAL